jgi:arylsulfatase A-like enzyme
MESRASRNTLSRRDALKLKAAALGSTAGVSFLSAGQPRNGKMNRPNFIIFMTDGQRPDEFSYMLGNNATGLKWDQCKVNPILRTPNMDRIAREGVWFHNAFAVNALCAPGRASTLTGMYSRAHGVIDNKDRPIAPGLPILSDILRDAGYEVAFCGKSHVRNALRDRYWDYYFGYLGQANYFGCRIATGVNGHIGPDRTYSEWVDDVVTQAAVDWLEARHDRPFCLFLWFYSPHGEGIRPRRYLDLYNRDCIPKPSTFDDDLKGYPGKPKAFANATNKIGLYLFSATLEQLVKGHYATIVGVDDNIGRVLHALERTGKLDDTAILHTADHGFFLGEWRLMDKRLMHEPSIRIPLIIRYPRVIRFGTFDDRMALNIDIAPTVLELAGIKPPPNLHGRSLVPLIQGSGKDWRKDWLYSYYEYPGPNMVPKNHGIRTERYKLIEYYEQMPKEHELYDLQEDPLELHNLYGDPKYRELTAALIRRLNELREETGEA